MRNLIFLMIKPWCLQNSADITREFDKSGQRLQEGFVEAIPRELIERHYRDFREQRFFVPMIEDHVAKPAVVAVYHGKVEDFLAVKERVRRRFAVSIQQHPDYRRDAVHTSRDNFEFLNEVLTWGPYLHAR
jgi:nucleoside diphosphate kinase